MRSRTYTHTHTRSLSFSLFPTRRIFAYAAGWSQLGAYRGRFPRFQGPCLFSHTPTPPSQPASPPGSIGRGGKKKGRTTGRSRRLVPLRRKQSRPKLRAYDSYIVVHIHSTCRLVEDQLGSKEGGQQGKKLPGKIPHGCLPGFHRDHGAHPLGPFPCLAHPFSVSVGWGAVAKQARGFSLPPSITVKLPAPPPLLLFARSLTIIARWRLLSHTRRASPFPFLVPPNPPFGLLAATL